MTKLSNRLLYIYVHSVCSYLNWKSWRMTAAVSKGFCIFEMSHGILLEVERNMYVMKYVWNEWPRVKFINSTGESIFQWTPLEPFTCYLLTEITVFSPQKDTTFYSLKGDQITKCLYCNTPYKNKFIYLLVVGELTVT